MERLHVLLQEQRRLLAAIVTGLAVLAGLTAVRDSPARETILVAGRDLASGQVITADDLRTADVPPSSAPAGLVSRREAIGRQVAGPMRRGEALTDFRLVGPGSMAGYDQGAVFTTVRVDPADRAAISVGDRVDVVAVDPGGETPAEVVARDVEVVTVPAADESDTTAIGVVTTEAGALALASAGLSSRLSVISSSA